MSQTTDRRPWWEVDGDRVELRCPHNSCEWHETHVVDVRWEIDPQEGDRKHVRMEVRCEGGHGYVLSIANHAGVSYFRWEPLSDIRSPLPPFGGETDW